MGKLRACTGGERSIHHYFLVANDEKIFYLNKDEPLGAMVLRAANPAYALSSFVCLAIGQGVGPVPVDDLGTLV